MSPGGNIQRSPGTSQYLGALITSGVGTALLLLEEFGAWQDRDSFFGVTEGWVWIGSTKAAPWAQIIILVLGGVLTYCAYIAYNGFRGASSVSDGLARRGYIAALAVTGLSAVFGLVFVVMVSDSDWWWFGGGFYGALIGGALTAYQFRRIVSAH